MKSNKELVIERALRSGFQDKDYQLSLLTMANTMYDRRLQNIALLVYKALSNLSPSYIQDLFYISTCHQVILWGLIFCLFPNVIQYYMD